MQSNNTYFNVGGDNIYFFSNLNPILQAFLATTFTFLLTIMGSSFVFLFKGQNEKMMHFIKGVTGGVMLSVVIFSLLTPAIEMSNTRYNLSFLIPTLGLILGTAFVLFNSFYITRNTKIKDEERKGILLAIVAMLHNIPEGIVIGITFASVSLGLAELTIVNAVIITIGVSLQNLPESACVSLTLKSSGVSSKKAFFIGASSGLVQPFAGILGALFALSIGIIMPLLLAFASGAMLVVAISEIIPESLNKHKVLAIAGIMLGFIIMMIMEVAFL